MYNFSFPAECAAQVAPLPLPLAQHLYHSMLRQSNTPTNVQKQLVQEVAESRRSIYFVMDSYVRNRRIPAPRHLRFTSEFVRNMLGMHTPNKKPIPMKTFSHWIGVGFVQTESKGRPTPDSAAHLGILRKIITTHDLLPERMNPRETWHCYTQESPDHPIRTLPVSDIANLPPAALVWTPWPGAAWRGWKLVGDAVGAISFAGMRPNGGYDLSLEDILRWKPGFAPLYQPEPGCEDDEIQALAQLALVHLARRIPSS